MKKLLIGLGIVCMLAFVAWIVIGYIPVAGIETPKYHIVEQKGEYEIRQYPAQIVAEVTVKAGYRDALNGGFRKLADFIFGNNVKGGASEKIAMTAPVLEREQKSEKIAMTAPVLERKRADSTRVISFVMPGRYTMDTLPKPKSPDVKLVEAPPRTYAAIQFSGTVPESKARKMKEKLIELTARDGFNAVGEPILAQYNPPWTPPFMRRNEVWLEVK